MRVTSFLSLNILTSAIKLSFAVPLTAFRWSDVDSHSNTSHDVNARHAQDTLEKRGNCCGTPSPISEIQLSDDGDQYDPELIAPGVPISEPSSIEAVHDDALPADTDDHPSDYSSLIGVGEDNNSPPFEPSLLVNQWGEQLPLAEISRSLGERGWEAVWDQAERRGNVMRSTLDYYVGNHRSRLDDGLPKPKAFRDVYDVQVVFNSQARYLHEHLEGFYAAVGISSQDTAGHPNYYEYKIYSKGEETQPQSPPGVRPGTLPVLTAAINVELQVMVVYEMFAFQDGNTGTDRLYSSELMFQLFQDVAEEDASRKNREPAATVQHVKYIVQDTITNQETRNMMRLTHLTAADTTNSDGSKPVTGIPKPVDGYEGKPLGPETGNGRWLSDHPLFNRLLNTPNVRPTVQLLMDHNTEMENPYPTVIHTFPRRFFNSANGLRQQDARDAYMVIELGPAPRLALSLPSSPVRPQQTPPGSVETS